MADIIAIELGFRQQVAAEALKNIPKRAKRVFLGSAVRARPSRLRAILIGREGRKNRYLKCEAIDARTLVRTQTTHLCLDSQFNSKSSRRDVSDLRFHD